LLLFLWMERNQLRERLKSYQTIYEDEKAFIPRFLSLLNNFPNCYERSLLSGHLTGSGWIVDRKAESVVLLHHKKLNRWLQPGGHADGEENICRVSSKEAEEETGLKSLKFFNEDIFDIDIHIIPARKNIRTHYHFDIRFLFIADHSEKIVVSDESNEVAWIPIDNVSRLTKNNKSIHRMILKTKLIFKSIY